MTAGEKFQNIKDKKILIYGTGKVAERLLMDILSGFQIVGIIDRTKFCGEKCGFPIMMWDDVQAGTVDVIVIASRQRFYQEIYQRIIEKCVSLGIQIYGANGQNLIQQFGLGINPYQDFKYYEKNAEALKGILAGYDVVCFDVFDTLIMRKTLEPTDVFDIVEARVKESGIMINKFKAIRRQAELMSHGQDIYAIYNILQELTGISDEWKISVLEEEIKCEKEFIIGRQAMIDIFNNVVAAGKRVYLVSDMYLTTELLTDILQGIGIQGYEKLYISCEHGVGKANGLFLKVREEIGDSTCIHVGDNEEVDIKSAVRYGLDSYRIYNAYDMLHNSSLCYVLGFANSTNDKNLIGLIISKLFNSPFSLYHTSGAVRISSLEHVGTAILAPLAVGYMSLLMEKVKKENYDGILFTARDEYFFNELYNRLYEMNLEKIPAYYISSSRILSIRSGIDDVKEMETVMKYVSGWQLHKVLKNIFGIDSDTEDKNSTQVDGIYAYKEEIMEHSRVGRKNYMDYFNAIGIDFGKKYLLCELDGKGTNHYYLNRFFEQGLDGFYMVKYHLMDDVYQLETEAMYDFWSISDECNSISTNIPFIESVFSAPHPTVLDMEEGGEPVFANEVRSEEEIGAMLKMQKAIMDFCMEYLTTMYISGKSLNRELPVHFLDLFSHIVYEGECEALYRGKLYDEMGDVYLDMIPEKG